MKKLVYLMVVSTIIISSSSCGGKKSTDKKAGDTTSTVASTGTVDVEKAKQELMAKDAEFSSYSAKNGTSEAFINFIADNGVLLRPNHRPIVGKDSVTLILNKKKAKAISMTWKPLFAEVAKSGELGYTYGTYEMSATDANGQKLNDTGTYVSIWQKDASGNWKLALDSGNEGLTPKNKQGNQQGKKHTKQN